MSIEAFPELHELIALFEAEPVSTDPEVPPEYNCLTFKTTVGEDTITCEIELGYETLWLGWERAGRELLALSLEQVKRIAVERNVERELLVVSVPCSRTGQPDTALAPLSPHLLEPEG